MHLKQRLSTLEMDGEGWNDSCGHPVQGAKTSTSRFSAQAQRDPAKMEFWTWCSRMLRGKKAAEAFKLSMRSEEEAQEESLGGGPDKGHSSTWSHGEGRARWSGSCSFVNGPNPFAWFDVRRGSGFAPFSARRAQSRAQSGGGWGPWMEGDYYESTYYVDEREPASSSPSSTSPGHPVFARPHLAVLDIPQTSVPLTKAALRAAFVEAAKKWHPDAKGAEGGAECRERFQRAREAYEALLPLVERGRA